MSAKCPLCKRGLTAQAIPVPASKPRSIEQIYSIKDLVAITSLSESTIRRRIDDGDFPPGSRTSKRRRGWLKSDLDAWFERLAGDGSIEVPKTE